MKVCLLSKGVGEGSDPKSILFGMNFGRNTKSGNSTNQCLFWTKLLGRGGVLKSLDERHTFIFVCFIEDLLYVTRF